MQKFTTLFFSLLLALIFFSSCKKKDSDDTSPVDPDPIIENNCATQKDWTDNQGKRFLLNEYEFSADKMAKINHYKPDGNKNETRMEYDDKGRVVNIFEKIAAEGTTKETNYLTTFEYSANERMVKTDNYKIVDGQNNLVQVRVYYYQDDKVIKLVSSAGVYWRYEYTANGNVAKTFFKPYNMEEYLLEEFTSYDDKLLNKTLQKAQILHNISLSPSGANLSTNNVLAYKIYNPDGSVKTSYNFVREYNQAGSQTKVITTTTSGTSITSTIETEYPTCK